MNLYQHKFEKVEDYLHHRSPYLMVDRIAKIEESAVETIKNITGDEYFMAGHFPGAPIFPGAMMQELTTQSAGILIAAKYNPMREFNTHDPFFNEYALGVLVRVKRAKYIGFARPGDTLHVRVELDERLNNVFDFSATIAVDGRVIMKNAFQLTNVKSTLLQGISKQSSST